jgi:hypothetical protein
MEFEKKWLSIELMKEFRGTSWKLIKKKISKFHLWQSNKYKGMRLG